MDQIKISSKLFDYTVDFVDHFSNTLKDFSMKTVYVIDQNVFQLYHSEFAVLNSQRIYLMNAVEHCKNMDTVMDLISFFERIGIKKDWKVVCFGGGITQDITTIASNLYLRNIEWYFFPTTLLAMCDSCIGGKCGINLGAYKNQIGVFYPPKRIYIDTHFLSTLTTADYLNGWGELLKFSLTEEEDFFNRICLEERFIPCERIKEYIYSGLVTKKKIIEEDEFESDLRRILNYGHTFGHALEAYTNNEIPHGKGVIWGIDVANYIAWNEGLIDEKYYLEIKSLIRRAFLKDEIVIPDKKAFFEIIKTDKKVKDQVIYMALLNARSHLIVHPVGIDLHLEQVFSEYLRETHDYYCS